MEHDPSVPPPHQLHQHHQHHHQHHQAPNAPQHPPHGMMVPPGNSFHPHHLHHLHHQHHHQQPRNMSSAPPQMIAPNSAALLQNSRFPFNQMVSPSSAPNSSKPLESLNSPYSADASSGLRPCSGGEGAGASSGGGFNTDPSKKKRGRPRKYSPDGGNIALGLSPTPMCAPAAQGESSETPSSDPSASKKHRGRPPGSGKRQLDALGNCGVGFTPHVILVNAGEDIAEKMMAFSQQGPRTICVLSANGSVCNFTLCQSSNAGGSVKYEGRYEIISMTGSYLLTQNGGNAVRTGGLSITLAGPDGRVVGGGVAGGLIAASPVQAYNFSLILFRYPSVSSLLYHLMNMLHQIIVGSFIADGKKPKYMPSVPESRMLHFGGPTTATSSPPSQEEGMSESSGENGNDPLLQQHRAPGPPQQHYNQQQQQIQMQQQMFSPMGWPNPGGGTTAKMLHHQ